jgi:hypothetical protein
MEWKGKYFTLYELTKSATASRCGIDNTPTEAIIKNLHELVVNVLDPLRLAWGQPIIVGSGYRCPKLNKLVGGAKNSQHCFDEKTEILTETGWKNYATISEEDNVYSYNVTNGEIELTPIDSIIIRNHQGKMMHMVNTCLDVMVTDKHRMLVRYPSHKYKRKGGKNITPEGQAYFDTLKTDNDKYHFEIAEDVYGKRRLYKCSGIYDGKSSADLPLLKFCMAFVSDGYWCVKTKSHAMGFRFKKERKIQHIQKLANDLGWPYTMNVDKHGVTNFYFRKDYGEKVFDVVGKKKILPNYLVGLSYSDKKALLECYASYDGNHDMRDDNGRFSISTTIKHNADVLQAMAATSGIKCSILIHEQPTFSFKGNKGIGKTAYTLMTCGKTEVKASENNYNWIDYNGTVWCVNNRNTTLVTRRNGKVSIQGNCYGMAADIRTVSDHPDDNMRLLKCLLEQNLPFDKLISEYVDSQGRPNWIHISYSPQHRRQKLTCKNGKYYAGITINGKKK